MNIALVTAFPPGKTTLNEYGWHFAKSLAASPKVSSLTILADEVPAGESYPDLGDKVKVIPSWRFNDLKNSVRIASNLRQIKPDGVILNVQFASFGDKPIPAALGLTLPVLLKQMLIPCVTLLHNIMETVDLESAAYASHPIHQKLLRWGGEVATRCLLRSDRLALTLPKYLDILGQKYGAQNLLHAPHGSFDTPESVTEPPQDVFRIMTFGKFGTYKKVEELVEAYQVLKGQNQRPMELVIAGSDSPKTPGYLKAIEEKYSHIEGIRFTGYVPEEEVPGLFQSSNVVVFPYTSTTGSSGVLHQAGSFARACVLPRIGDFVDLIESEGYRGEYFEPGEALSLATALQRLIDNPLRLQELSEINHSASLDLPMETVVSLYLSQIEELRTVEWKCEDRFDVWAVQNLKKVSQKALNQGKTIKMDLSRVRFLDQSAIDFLEEISGAGQLKLTMLSPQASDTLKGSDLAMV